jgi:hypothetical protein
MWRHCLDHLVSSAGRISVIGVVPTKLQKIAAVEEARERIQKGRERRWDDLRPIVDYSESYGSGIH